MNVTHERLTDDTCLVMSSRALRFNRLLYQHDNWGSFAGPDVAYLLRGVEQPHGTPPSGCSRRPSRAKPGGSRCHRSAAPDRHLGAARDEQLEPSSVENPCQASKFWIAGARKCPAHGDAIHARMPGDGGNATTRLGDIAQRKHERRLIALGKRGVHVLGRQLRIAKLLGQPFILRNRCRQVSWFSFHRPTASSPHQSYASPYACGNAALGTPHFASATAVRHNVSYYR